MYLLTNLATSQKAIYQLDKFESYYVCTLVKEINPGNFINFSFPIKTENFHKDFDYYYPRFTMVKLTEEAMMEYL